MPCLPSPRQHDTDGRHTGTQPGTHRRGVLSSSLAGGQCGLVDQGRQQVPQIGVVLLLEGGQGRLLERECVGQADLGCRSVWPQLGCQQGVCEPCSRHQRVKGCPWREAGLHARKGSMQLCCLSAADAGSTVTQVGLVPQSHSPVLRHPSSHIHGSPSTEARAPGTPVQGLCSIGRVYPKQQGAHHTATAAVGA